MMKSPIGDKEQVMQRRQFIRVAGGGVFVAATTPLAACSQALPPVTVAAWNGPGDESDLRRWLLGYAILAPHSHNLQSWVVDLSEPDQILLRCDLGRLLPETDPYSRQIMMSHGTFLELLDMAARERRHRAEITLFPEGAFGAQQLDGRPVARVRLAPDASVRPDPLFAQVLKRHTNRSAYDLARPVPAAAWQAMAAAVQPYSLRFGFAGPEQPEALARQRAVAAEAWRIELVTPRTLMESYKVLRVGADEVARHRDGLTLMDPMVVLLDRVGLFDRSRPPGAQDFATTSQIKDFNHKLDSTPGFLWMVSEGNDRVTQVNAGRAFMRVQLAATAHGVALQPLQQALQEYPEQAATQDRIRRLLGADAPGQTLQMWARVGFAPAVPPAPRRAVDAFIQRT
jgi:hypothetical protein